MTELHFDHLIKPEELDSYQEDWVRTVSKYKGLEKDFFKPYWVPIRTDTLGYFIDLSDNDFPIFKMEYSYGEPYRYYKTYLFEKISNLLLASDKGIDIKALNAMKYVSVMNQTEKLLEERRLRVMKVNH